MYYLHNISTSYHLVSSTGYPSAMFWLVCSIWILERSYANKTGKRTKTKQNKKSKHLNNKTYCHKTCYRKNENAAFKVSDECLFCVLSFHFIKILGNAEKTPAYFKNTITNHRSSSV